MCQVMPMDYVPNYVQSLTIKTKVFYRWGTIITFEQTCSIFDLITNPNLLSYLNSYSDNYI